MSDFVDGIHSRLNNNLTRVPHIPLQTVLYVHSVSGVFFNQSPPCFLRQGLSLVWNSLDMRTWHPQDHASLPSKCLDSKGVPSSLALLNMNSGNQVWNTNTEIKKNRYLFNKTWIYSEEMKHSTFLIVTYHKWPGENGVGKECFGLDGSVSPHSFWKQSLC